MSYHHLFSLLLLVTTFSSQPSPVRSRLDLSPVKTIVLPKEEDTENIPWMDARRLNWTDFLCAPRVNTDAVASTSTSLGLSYQIEEGSLAYGITCTFSKHKSWGSLKTDYILAHEQGHFDITEIFARKLHKALQEYAFNRKTYRRDLNQIYQQIVKEKEDMQAAYDGESDHSRNRRIQYDWLEKIDHLLEETAPWANYP